MRSLAIVVAAAATLLACSGDEETPPADQPAAIVAPTSPAPPAGETATSKTSAAATDPAASEKTEAKKDEPAKTDPPAADETDDVAFADLAGKLNDCLAECKDASCGGACLSELQGNLPKKEGVQGGSSMCCTGANAFFVCHGADAEPATCDANAENPGPNCQPVPAMDVICKAKAGG